MKLSTILWVTVSASAVDSLNPIAIAQQFALQSMVEKKRAIIGFIAGLGVTNLAAGLLVYYGLAALFRRLLDGWLASHQGLVRMAAVVLGLALAALGLWFAYTKWVRKAGTPERAEETKRPLSLTWPSLFLMGIGFCLLELTSALPYFAYLAFFVQVPLSFPVVFAVLFLYNFIYSLPLILMLIASVLLGERLQGIYVQIQRVISALLRVAPPILLLVLGVFSILYGTNTI